MLYSSGDKIRIRDYLLGVFLVIMPDSAFVLQSASSDHGIGFAVPLSELCALCRVPFYS